MLRVLMHLECEGVNTSSTDRGSGCLSMLMLNISEVLSDTGQNLPVFVKEKALHHGWFFVENEQKWLCPSCHREQELRCVPDFSELNQEIDRDNGIVFRELS